MYTVRDDSAHARHSSDEQGRCHNRQHVVATAASYRQRKLNGGEFADWVRLESLVAR